MYSIIWWCLSLNTFSSSYLMFISRSHDLLRQFATKEMTYGAAVTDIDGDGNLDVVVASFSGSNIVLVYNNKSRTLQNVAKTGTLFEAIMDPDGRAVGVASCDVDGDGKEEIYILNSNIDITGRKTHGDKLFKYVDNRYVDLLSDSINAWIPEVTRASHSVTCIDRQGTGLYAIAVVASMQNGTERIMLIEMDESHPDNNRDSGPIVLRDVAKDAGIDHVTGGRGMVIGPILGTEGRSDIFVNTESVLNGNKLFMNIGGGKFKNIARQMGLADTHQKGRGVAVGDINEDGLIDIVTGGWLGSNRLFIQRISSYSGRVKFIDMATSEIRKGSALCSLAVADFNNDGYTDIFYNSAMHHGPQPNRLFTVRTTTIKTRQELNITEISIGEALEPRAYPTGSVVTDIDRDGVLDILITHGESSGNTITVYSTSSPKTRSKNRRRDRTTSQRSKVIPKTTFGTKFQGKIIHKQTQGPVRHKNYWVRVFPKTRFGAPARGSKVTLVLAGGILMTQVIGGGSGYSGQMEPVAHFGIGQTADVLLLEIQWPDGKIYQRQMGVSDLNKLHEVHWSDTHQHTSIFKNKHVDKRLLRITGTSGLQGRSLRVTREEPQNYKGGASGLQGRRLGATREEPRGYKGGASGLQGRSLGATREVPHGYKEGASGLQERSLGVTREESRGYKGGASGLQGRSIRATREMPQGYKGGASGLQGRSLGVTREEPRGYKGGASWLQGRGLRVTREEPRGNKGGASGLQGRSLRVTREEHQGYKGGASGLQGRGLRVTREEPQGYKGDASGLQGRCLGVTREEPQGLQGRSLRATRDEPRGYKGGDSGGSFPEHQLW